MRRLLFMLVVTVTVLTSIVVLPAPPASAAFGAMIVPATGQITGTTAGYCQDGTSHAGIDIAAVGGSSLQVVAAAGGTVTVAQSDVGDYGTHVVIDHGGGWTTLYGHMVVGSLQVSAGQVVPKGAPLGTMGDTGASDGVHLHFGVYLNGVKWNPISSAFTCWANVSRGAPIALDFPGLSGGSNVGGLPSALRQVVGQTTGWSDLDTGMILDPTLIFATNMGGTWPYITFAQEGRLWTVTGNSTGWHLQDTGVLLSPTSMSAVNMGGTAPVVMAIEGSKMYEIKKVGSTWTKTNTGQIFTGQISAVNRGGTKPEVMLAQDGVLYHVVYNGSGWQTASTLIAANGPISAVYMGGNWPQVMLQEGGQLYQIYGDATGWHKGATNVAAAGAISAVKMSGNWPVVMLSEGGALYQVVGTPTGWQKLSLGVGASGRIAAVNMGGTWPQIIKIG